MQPGEVESAFKWGAVLAIIIILTALLLIYRQQLTDLMTNIFKCINKVTVNILGLKIDIDIEKLKQYLKHFEPCKKIPNEQTAVSPKSAGTNKDIAGRDIVLNLLGNLEQTINDAAIAQNMKLSMDSHAQDVVQRLLGEKLIPVDVFDALDFLIEEGQRVMDTSRKVDVEQALIYKEVADAVIDWMLLNIPIDKGPQGTQDSWRRQTVVGGMGSGMFFEMPGRNKPIARLVGKTGELKDHGIQVNKEPYKIGRDPDNDLCLEHDEYVSGHHAHIKYMDNNLFLYDLNSRNGTFVNGRKITGTSCALQRGDTIKFGSAVFEIS